VGVSVLRNRVLKVGFHLQSLDSVRRQTDPP
jgi:hypothetical protein